MPGFDPSSAVRSATERWPLDQYPLHISHWTPVTMNDGTEGVCVGWACEIAPERRLVGSEVVEMDPRCEKCQLKHEMLVVDQDVATHRPWSSNNHGEDARRLMGRS